MDQGSGQPQLDFIGLHRVQLVLVKVVPWGTALLLQSLRRHATPFRLLFIDDCVYVPSIDHHANHKISGDFSVQIDLCAENPAFEEG